MTALVERRPPMEALRRLWAAHRESVGYDPPPRSIAAIIVGEPGPCPKCLFDAGLTDEGTIVCPGGCSPLEAERALLEALHRSDSAGIGASDGSSIDAIRRALLEEAQDPRDSEGPAREELPGAAGLLHRGVSAVLFGERGEGKSTVALALALGAANAGERVLYLDRENGPALLRDRVHDALPGLGLEEWPEALTVRCFPSIGRDWQPEDFGEAVAGLGFGAVVFDSLREFLTELGLSENTTDDISILVARLVTPLVRRNVAVVLLDNVGHENTHRPKGSGAKLDATPQAFKVASTEPFSPVQTGRVSITCERSRYGDLGRKWTMAVGGDVFELPVERADTPAAKAVRRQLETREKVRRTAIEVLGEGAPLGRDSLASTCREKGIELGSDPLRELLKALAADPASGLIHTSRGYDLSPDLAESGQGEVNPPDAPLT